MKNIKLNIICKYGHLIGDSKDGFGVIDFENNELRYWCSQCCQVGLYPVEGVIKLTPKRTKDE